MGASDQESPAGGEADESARRVPPQSAVDALLSGGRRRSGLRHTGLDRDRVAAVIDDLFFEGPRRLPYLRRFGVLLVLSTTIAAFGLLADSAAVVIGAMLVAPLLTPIVAVSACIIQGWVQRLAASVSLLVIGSFAGIATGWFVGLIGDPTAVSTALPGELLARTTPGLLDLGIAVAAGAAAGYVLVDREATAALPGAGIAVALVPPLATVGICLEFGEGDLAMGALLLYVTNLAAIVLAAALTMLAMGFVPSLGGVDRPRVIAGLAVAGAAVVAVAIPLGLHTQRVVQDRQLNDLVVRTVPDWDPSVNITDLHVDTSGARDQVELQVAGPSEPQPAWRLADLLADAHGDPLRVEVTSVSDVEAVAEVR